MFPKFLFGTYKKINKESIICALNNNIKAFDLAYAYNTIDLVLDTISECDNLKRSDFYFAYKLDSQRLKSEEVKTQVFEVLEKIDKVFNDGSKYIDLLMIHSPNHKIPIEETWNTMKELNECGYVKKIGVSNFNEYHLEYMRKSGIGLPSINQIECHPFFSQKNLIKYCEDNGIMISSYRSNVSSIDNTISPDVINNWKYTKGYQIVSISMNEDHIKKFNLFEMLDKETMDYLDSLDRVDGRLCNGKWASFDFNDEKWIISNNK